MEAGVRAGAPVLCCPSLKMERVLLAFEFCWNSLSVVTGLNIPLSRDVTVDDCVVSLFPYFLAVFCTTGL